MLGSGKTSTILRIAEILASKNVKIAVIENEIGSIGIDGEILERFGMKVRELKGGCICCTMKTGMIDTLRTIEAHIKPDLAIIEPTGIADPNQVITAMDGVTGLNVTGMYTIIMVDAERILKVKKMFERPLKNQLSVADLVLINKVDTVTEDDVKDIESLLRDMSYNGPVLRVQADSGKNIDKAAEMIP